MRALGILLLASLAEHCQAAVAARIWVSSVDMHNHAENVINYARDGGVLAGHSINNHDLAKEVQYLTGTVLPSAAPGVVLAIKSDFGAGVVEALGQIAARNVPIVCIEKAPPSNPGICTLRVVPDDYQAGRLLAEQFCMRQNAATANFVVFKTTPTTAECETRFRGFSAGIAMLCPKFSSGLDKAMLFSSGSKPTDGPAAGQATQAAFSVDGTIDSIFTCEQVQAQTVAETLHAYRETMTRGVLIGSGTCDDAVERAVLSGDLFACSDHLYPRFGRVTVDLAKKVAVGITPPTQGGVVYTDIQLITTDKMAFVWRRIMLGYDRWAVPFLQASLPGGPRAMPVNHVEPGEKTAGADNASSSFLQEGSGAQLGEANTNQNQNKNQIKKKGDTTPTAADSEVGSKRQDNLTFSTGKGAQTGAEAVSVRVKIRVVDVLKIDIMAGTFTTLLVMTYKWTDERLYYTPTELHGAIKRHFIPAARDDGNKWPVWVPDVCTLTGQFRTLKEVIRVRPFGTVELTMQTEHTALADFDLRMFPFDSQHVDIRLQSFSYPNKVWRFAEPRAADVNLHLEYVDVWRFKTPKFDFSKHTHAGPKGNNNFEDLVLTFHLDRDRWAYVQSFVFPMFGISLVTWTAMLMDPGGEAGLNLALNTVLAMVGYLYVLAMEVPKTPYLSWLAIFVMLSVVLVLLATMEIAIMSVMCAQYASLAAMDPTGQDRANLLAEEEEEEEEGGGEGDGLLDGGLSEFDPEVPNTVRKIRKITPNAFIYCVMLMNCVMLAWGVMQV